MLYYSTNKKIKTTFTEFNKLRRIANNRYQKAYEEAFEWHSGYSEEEWDSNNISEETMEYLREYPNSSSMWLGECERKAHVDAALSVLHMLLGHESCEIPPHPLALKFSKREMEKLVETITGRDLNCDRDWMW